MSWTEFVVGLAVGYLIVTVAYIAASRNRKLHSRPARVAERQFNEANRRKRSKRKERRR